MPEIKLTPSLEKLLNEHAVTISEAKARRDRDIMIMFEANGITLPPNPFLKIENGVISFEEPKKEEPKE